MLKPYMAYSRAGGSHEGAFLVFAHNIKEAKRVGWPALHELICEDYIDMAIRLLKGDHLYLDANKEKLAADIAHVIDSPTSCKRCETWGEPLDSEGVCQDWAAQQKFVE
jgi:hypothetical protein